MEKLLELDKDDNILVSHTILEYNSPDYIYIPLHPNYQIVVSQNKHVSIGDIILTNHVKSYTSPISGTITGLKSITTLNGKLSALEIKNDFKETKKLAPTHKITLNNLNKEAFAKLLKQEYDLDLTSKTSLVLNCLDDEPYVLTENFYLLLYYEGFLELLDKLSKTFNITSITLAVKSTSSENINKLLECLGMYPLINLQIIPNLYLLGHDEFLLKYLNLNPAESLVIKASTFYHIYNLVKRNRQKNTELITISGPMLKNPSIIQTKIGVLAEPLINSLIELEEGDKDFYINGLMSGKIMDLTKFIITEDIHSIIITEKKETKEGKCLNCGLCLEVCPKNLNPLLLKNSQYLAKNREKCLNCGLCSYICPVYINFNKYLKGAENNVS